MAEIIDFTKKKLEQGENGIFYVMDPENWNPLAFVAEKTLFLCPKLARVVRHHPNEYDFVITDDLKIVLFQKSSGYLWIWESNHVLDQELLEEIFGEQVLGNIEKLAFHIHEMGWSKKGFSNIEEVLNTISGDHVHIMPDRNPR